jgi:D-proline reductase (dithiol) PrdB
LTAGVALEDEMAVDSFKWLPGSLAGYYKNLPVQREEPIPWTPLRKPLGECRFALVTTAAIHVMGREPPFDTEREEREPRWGDPSFRTIPRDVRQDQIGACHLHINNRDILADLDIVLPIQRFLELEAAGEIGSLAPTHYSFMGYQPDTTEWRERYGPEAAQRARQEDVDAVLFTPA